MKFRSLRRLGHLGRYFAEYLGAKLDENQPDSASPPPVALFDRENDAQRSWIFMDTISLSFWLIAYLLVAIILNAMMRELSPNYEFPRFQLLVNFVIPVCVCPIGIVGNMLLLATRPVGANVVSLRIYISYVWSVLSIPAVGYESSASFGKNAVTLFFVALISAACLIYYWAFHSTVIVKLSHAKAK